MSNEVSAAVLRGVCDKALASGILADADQVEWLAASSDCSRIRIKGRRDHIVVGLKDSHTLIVGHAGGSPVVLSGPSASDAHFESWLLEELERLLHSRDYWKRAPRAWRNHSREAPHRLDLRMRVPFPPNLEGMSPNMGVGFLRWLPQQDAALVAADGPITARFYMESGRRGFPMDPDEIARTVNVHAWYSMCDVVVDDLDADLVGYMCSDSGQRGSEGGQPELRKRYEELGARVYRLVSGTLNRVIRFARNVLGQFWLDEIPRDPQAHMEQAFTKWKTTATIDGSFRTHWRPTSTSCPWTLHSYSEDFYLTADQWGSLNREEEERGVRAAIGEFLSNAMRLAQDGQLRSAIVEADSALERALYTLPERDSHWDARCGGRLQPAKFKGAFKKAGFSGVMKLLIPLLFSEAELDQNTLTAGVRAHELRNAVIHAGARKLTESKTQEHIWAIRRLIRALDKAIERAPEAA